MTYGYEAWCCATLTSLASLDTIHKRAKKIINAEIKEIKQALNDKLKRIVTAALQNSHPLNELIPKTRSEGRKRTMRNDSELSIP